MTSPPDHARHRLRFGLCADVHRDIMHDADQRLRVFIDRMIQERVDFILHLNDFCRPYDHNRAFLEVWNSFPGERFHVLGNHETDGGFTRDQVTAHWGSPGRYYSRDMGGYHLIMLDGNGEREGRPPGYPRYIGDQQLDWLRNDLAGATAPTLVFSQMGDEYQHIRYGADVDHDFPWIKYTAPYRDPLYALASLDPTGVLSIEGTDSEFVGPSPWDLQFPHREMADRIVPGIRSRALSVDVAL